MSGIHAEAFSHALHVALKQPHAASAKEAGNLITVFMRLIKNVIDSIGLGDLTRDEFLSIVATAFDTFTASMGLPPMLAAGVKALVLMIAGRIWDKRHKPTPAQV